MLQRTNVLSISIQCSYSAFTSWVFSVHHAFLLKSFLYNVRLNCGLAPFRLFSEVLVQGVSLTLGMKKYGRWNGRFLICNGRFQLWYGKFCLLWNMEDLAYVPFHSMPWHRCRKGGRILKISAKGCSLSFEW